MKRPSPKFNFLNYLDFLLYDENDINISYEYDQHELIIRTSKYEIYWSLDDHRLRCYEVISDSFKYDGILNFNLKLFSISNIDSSFKYLNGNGNFLNDVKISWSSENIIHDQIFNLMCGKDIKPISQLTIFI